MVLRAWLKWLLVLTFVSYMCICMYIIHIAQPRDAIKIYKQDVVSGPEQEVNVTKNWHFDPAGHELFHEEQRKLAAQEKRRLLEQAFVNSSASKLFGTWLRSRSHVPGCSVDVYASKLVLLHNTTLHGSLAKAKRKGGEDIQHVINQADQDEEYEIKAGYFTVPCRVNSSVCKIPIAGKAHHLVKWSKTVACSQDTKSGQDYDSPLTVLITRYEYANVYWTMMDLYDTYLTVTFLNHTLADTHLLIVDAHPSTPLDGLWMHLFRNVSRPYQIGEVAKFRKVAWTFGREYSPMLEKGTGLPLVHVFRKTVLDGFKVPDDHVVSCRELNVLFIWRRNYVAHPRNPEGIISRKISNENELLSACREAFPGFNVTGVQLDKLPMQEQIRLLSGTDVLIGMHGAAFGFNMLLPASSVVVEMFPQGSAPNWHMEYIAKWSGHQYLTWTNTERALEDKLHKSTKVPPETVVMLLGKAAKALCSGNGKPRNDGRNARTGVKATAKMRT